MTDPYKVLGVSPDASDDDVKKAYRELARKYHPDKYRDSDLADLASEKMKEVNAAYEEIQKMRASGSSHSNGGYNSQSYAGNTSSNPKYAEVRRLINNGNDVQAENILDAVHEGDRTAEWHFLKGCVAARRGFFVDAQRYFDTACSMDPYNNEYRAAQNNLRMRAGGYGYGGGYNTAGGGCTMCDLCAGLMCLDCLCDCI